MIAIGLLLAPIAWSLSFTPGKPIDPTPVAGNVLNPSIVINNLNPSNMFVVAATDAGPGVNPLVVSYSTNSGKTWTTNMIANGGDGLTPAYGYPSAAFDSLGNLYVAYEPAGFEGIAVAVSTNGGVTFTQLAKLSSSDATETPRIAAGPASVPGSVWLVYKDYSLPGTPLVAHGMQATAIGTNNQFGPPIIIQDTALGGFPDIAVGPQGQVMVAYQDNITNSDPANIYVNVNTNAFGTNGFGPPIQVALSAVGGKTYIPAQSTGIGINATPGVAFDCDPYSSFYGKAYVIFTALNNSTQRIGLCSSTNNGASWSPTEYVEDDTSGNSHFMPRVAVDPITGIVAASWFDCRNDLGPASQTVSETVTSQVEIMHLANVSNIVWQVNGTIVGLDIETNMIDATTYSITISGNNLTGTIISNNNTNIIYVTTRTRPFITFNLEGETGTNAGSTNTTFMVTLNDFFPDAYTSGKVANEEPVAYSTISLDGGATFLADQQAVSAAIQINPNSLVNPPVFGYGSYVSNSASPLGFGNYTGLAFYAGQFFPAWADNADIGLTNPNGPNSTFNITISDLVIPITDLTVIVSNTPNPILADGAIAFTITAFNNGPLASDCVITDTLPENVTFESAVPSLGATYSITGQQFVLTIPSIPALGSASALVLCTASGSGFGTNIATIEGPLTDPRPFNNTNILFLTFVGEDLGLSASISETNVFGGQVVSNVLSITNNGPSANGDIIVSNVFSSNWGLLTVLSPGWSSSPNAVSPGTYSVKNNVMLLNVGVIPTNGFSNIVVAATALATSPTGTIDSTVSSLGFDPDPTNNSASFSVAMTAETIGASLTAGPSQVGVPTTFSVTVTNFGPSPFGSITISNIFPKSFGTISVVSSNTATIVSNLLVIPLGQLGSNESTTVVFTAVPQSVGTVTDKAIISCFDSAPTVIESVVLSPTAPPSPIENFKVLPGSSGALLVWDTPVPATVQVDYGTTPAYGSFSSLSAPSLHHVVLLSGLARGSNYYFNAISMEGGLLYVTNGTFPTVNSLILGTQDATYTGSWTEINSGAGIFGGYYFSADTTAGNPTASATFTPMISTSGKYDVSIWYPLSTAFATNTPVFVSGGTNEIFTNVNESVNGGSWQALASGMYFAVGASGNVVIKNNTGSTNNAVAANGMRWDYSVSQDNPGNGGVPQWWSSGFFGTNNVSGSEDSDGDGYSNYAEYVFGTDPTDPASRLNFAVTPIAGNLISVTFSPYQSGRAYQLLTSTELTSWLALTNQPTVDTNGIATFTVSRSGVANSIFYRLSATITQ
ncbi:MAG TPA: hypothetical protein VGO67_16560 [Verrucomicrobiae bacterium]